MTTETTPGYLIRRLSETPTERGVCGWRKTLVTQQDTPVANVSHLTINDSRYHYHKIMTAERTRGVGCGFGQRGLGFGH